LSNILAQKKEIKRLEKTHEKEEKEAEEDRAREDAEAKERAVQEFEKIQMGLEAKMSSSSSTKTIVGREGGKILVEEDVVGGKRGEKRKFELDEDELLRIAQEERTKARKAIDDERVRAFLKYIAPYILIKVGLQNDLAFLLGSVHHTFIKHANDAS
jgi:nitric oxide synthase-interacting protein